MAGKKVAFALVLVAAAASPVPAAAQAKSPAIAWAGCAGALALKSHRTEDGALKALLAPMARRALDQSKRAENPTGLTPRQLDAVALSAATRFKDELAADPSRVPAFEKAVDECMNGLAKLPG